MRTIALVCPTNPNHGQLQPLTGNPNYGFYCPHAEHDGRLNHHPDGPAAPTRAFFTTMEVEAASTLRAQKGSSNDALQAGAAT